VNGEGWLEAVLGSNGYFSVVSDYENYAFRWTHFGKRDFREFLLGLDSDYVRSKLDPRRVLDADSTIAALRARVCEMRRKKQVDSYDAREAFDRANGINNYVDLSDWCNEWRDKIYLGDEWDNFHEKPEPAIMAFVTHALPRLKQLIRYELWTESTTT